MEDYRAISMWHDTVGEDDYAPRPSLPGPTDADVCIVGAGYTGLWTAYYLKKADPTLRIVVLEKEVAGFGASGRNGGWCSPFFASSMERLAKAGGRGGAVALQREMFATVREVGRVCDDEGIEADYHRGGNLFVAANQAQATRTRETFHHLHEWGFGEEDLWWLGAEEARDRIAIAGALGAMYSPHCARVHPAKLVRGLARVVEGLGVPIYERTPVLDRTPGGVRTPQGDVKAPIVVRATEGYTAALPRLRRNLLPLYSLMIATEPLPEDVWSRIGWEGNECWIDGRHLLVYLSRTADGRIAIGGRGDPYHFGSRVVESFERSLAVFDTLCESLRLLLPQVRGAAITHRWGGPIGIARDWCSTVGFDRAGGSAWACGYVGDGVATSNLAGRTLRDLITEQRTDLTRLPWIGHHSRRWEPEPFRFIGVNLAVKAWASADKAEARTGKPAKRAAYMEKLIS